MTFSQNNAVQPPTHKAFEWIRSQRIDSLNVSVEEYRHRKTGAVHYHMAADNDENVFLVALRTVPTDSSGVAHVLEHTALCGSERYPVRDPFFMMIRRSLNTFMNAFTSSDWTAYPFASQNRKDFNNLLDVYLDAVFFSRLDELDFLQEGHRIEFAEADNTDSDLVYKGVVFNEMKGAMSSVSSTLWQTLSKYLFPTTTYHYNSGGDPEHIPELSYAQLKAFYKSHYHPSNAIFMTYGDIDAQTHQQCFEQQALGKFDKLDIHIQVPQEQHYLEPQRFSESYAYNEGGSSDNKTHVIVGWLLGDSTDLTAMLQSQLLASVLLDNSNSPLQRVLETSDLGSSPSPLCGLEDSMRELVFVCGLEGANSDDADAVEQLIMDTLLQVADHGVPLDQVQAVLHQLELHQREIGGDGYPYGLQLILSAMGNATHRGDPIAVLNLDPVLEQLHLDIQDPSFIPGLARKLLLENNHRVTLVMTPDTELAGQREQAETDKLAKIKAALSASEKQQLVSQAQALNERQLQKDDESILPKVGLEDVPTDIRIINGHSAVQGAMPTTSYTQGTNGLVYQQLFIELPALTDEQAALLPYYSNYLTELGIGEQDYLQTQARQAAICGSIGAFTTLRSDIDNEQKLKAYLILSSKALARNQHLQAELMRETIEDIRFDEYPRMRELIAQQRARREQSVTNNGHGLAMSAASSGMSPIAQFSHQVSGLAGIQAIKALDDSIQSDTELHALGEQLREIHRLVLAASKQYLIVAEADRLKQCQQSIAELWPSVVTSVATHFALPTIRETKKQLWVANTQVNFCAKAYPTVTADHVDAPALIVLGGYLRNGFLHRAVREQGGAYGGGASQDSSIAAFRFYSYRDPRLVDTLSDFDASIDWLLTTQHDAEPLEQAILGVISSLDKPGSPAGEAKQAFHNTLFKRTDEQRRAFRQSILAVTQEDLLRVANSYLKPELASIAIVTSSARVEQLSEFIEQQQLQVYTL